MPPGIVSRVPRTFAEEVIEINLRRIIWICAVILFSDIVIVIISNTRSDLFVLDRLIHRVDIGVCLAFGLSSMAFLRGGWRPVRPMIAYIGVFLLVQLVLGDIYYFNLLPEIGPTTLYVVTVVLLGVLLLVPPWAFLAAVLGNHAIYLVWLFAFDVSPPVRTAMVIDGSFGVAVSITAQFIIFSARLRDYRREKHITTQSAQLAAANAQLRRRSEEIEEVLAIASHDIRSPLQGLKNLLDVAARDTQWRKPPYADVLTESRKLCEGLLDMLARLLRAYPVQAGPALARPAIDLVSVVRDAIARVAPQASLKDVNVTLLSGEPAPQLHLDPDRLTQALDNLLTNAVKFSPSGKEVQVEISCEVDHCIIDIRDDGPGTSALSFSSPSGKLERTPHQDSGTTESFGLGLYIVRKNLDAIGAELLRFPREPRGTVFRIRLPLVSAPSKDH